MSEFAGHFERWIDSLKAMNRYRRLFVTGCPKSGTTWLAKLLNGHPQIVVEGEGRFAWRMYNLLEQVAHLFNQDQKDFAGSPLATITDVDFAMQLRSMTDNFFHRYLINSGKDPAKVQVVGDKTPQHVFHVHLLRAIYPECRFINIIRDPRDAATSALFHLAKGDSRPSDVYVEEFITQTWQKSVEVALNAERILGSGLFLNIRYEDLHEAVETVTGQCVRFLEVDSSPESTRACVEAGSFEKLSGGRKRGEKDQNAFFRNGMVGDWVNHLDSALAARCCDKVNDLMKHFGYSPRQAPITVSLHIKRQPQAA